MLHLLFHNLHNRWTEWQHAYHDRHDHTPLNLLDQLRALK